MPQLCIILITQPEVTTHVVGNYNIAYDISVLFQRSMQLKWGIAGVGMIAHDFLTAMGTLSAEQHKAVAVAGKDLDRVHRLATLHKINTAYEGYESLARDDSIGNKTFYCLHKRLVKKYIVVTPSHSS